MKNRFMILTGLLVWSAQSPVMAEPIDYVSDPLFEPISPGDAHPLQGLINLAMDDDARAQFILGDLYSKGKGGVAQNRPLAKTLFEHSSKNGHYEAFIRLAAIAREEGDLISAWKWYSLADERLKWGEAQDWAAGARHEIEKQMDGADRRAARTAFKDWKIKRLPPLVLHDPLSPLGTTPTIAPENRAESSEEDITAQDTEEDTETETEDLSDEQN